MKSLQEELLELHNPAPSAGSEDEDELARNHYSIPTESKLRKELDISEIDHQYEGKPVSRKNLNQFHSDSESEIEDESSEDNRDFEELMQSQIDSDFDRQSLQEETDHSESDNEKSSISVNLNIAKFNDDSQKMLSKLSEDAKSEMEKGKSVKSQITLWERLLDTRIRIQKPLDLVNTLPNDEIFKELEPESTEQINLCSQSIKKLLGSLIDIKLKMLEAEQTIPKVNINVKRPRETDAIWKEVIGPLENTFSQFRDETIDKWNQKVQPPNTKKFKVINCSVSQQIQNAMSDSERLIKRTKLMRRSYDIIGQSPAEPTNDHIEKENEYEEFSKDKHLKTYNDNIFDDSDYYQHLLKELIESRTSQDPHLAAKFSQLKQANKKKNAVDTKASKGRKIRYAVQEKIQNFMACEPRGNWHEEMINELFSSLLGNKIEFF